jgi:hypothetical protein
VGGGRGGSPGGQADAQAGLLAITITSLVDDGCQRGAQGAQDAWAGRVDSSQVGKDAAERATAAATATPPRRGGEAKGGN